MLTDRQSAVVDVITRFASQNESLSGDDAELNGKSLDLTSSFSRHLWFSIFLILQIMAQLLMTQVQGTRRTPTFGLTRTTRCKEPSRQR
jgi:hypothetical protein